MWGLSGRFARLNRSRCWEVKWRLNYLFELFELFDFLALDIHYL